MCAHTSKFHFQTTQQYGKMAPEAVTLLSPTETTHHALKLQIGDLYQCHMYFQTIVSQYMYTVMFFKLKENIALQTFNSMLVSNLLLNLTIKLY